MFPGALVLIRRLCSKPPSRPWYLAPVERFEQWLRVKHPATYKMQRTVMDGGKHCFADLKMYWRVSSGLREGKTLEQFTRQELEVYILTPTDIEKLAVIAFVIALPMTIFIMAIALVFFPRLLLTRHFWTMEQTEKFRSIILEKRRRFHYGKIAESLAQEVQRLDNRNSTDFVQALKNPPIALRQLEHYLDVLEKVNIDSLNPAYQFHLARAHGLWTWGSKSGARLRLHAQILATLDSKLRSERLDNMSLPDLKQSLYIRQFDIVHLTDAEELQLLKDWLTLTEKSPSSSSIVLHAPIVSQLHLKNVKPNS